MSLKVSVSANKTIITLPEQSVKLNGEITINRIVDMPSEKKVFVLTKELGKIDLPSLSDENYDTPSEWTNADVVSAIEQYVNSISPQSVDIEITETETVEDAEIVTE
jgi:hypothetical protein